MNSIVSRVIWEMGMSTRDYLDFFNWTGENCQFWVMPFSGLALELCVCRKEIEEQNVFTGLL